MFSVAVVVNEVVLRDSASCECSKMASGGHTFVSV